MFHAQQPFTNSTNVRTHNLVIRRAPDHTEPDPWLAPIIDAAGLMLYHGADLIGRRDKRFLYDIRKGRYPFRSLQRLCDIAVAIPTFGSAVAPVEAQRRYIVRGKAKVEVRAVCSRTSWRAEDEHEHALNRWQIAYGLNPSQQNRDAVIHHAAASELAVRLYADDVHAEGVRPSPIYLIP